MDFQGLLIDKEELYLKPVRNNRVGVKVWKNRNNIFSIHKDKNYKNCELPYIWKLLPSEMWSLKTKTEKGLTEKTQEKEIRKRKQKSEEKQFSSMAAAKQNALEILQQVLQDNQFKQIDQQLRIVNGNNFFNLQSSYNQHSTINISGKSKNWFIKNDYIVNHIWNYKSNFCNIFATKQEVIDYLHKMVSENLGDIYQNNKKLYQQHYQYQQYFQQLKNPIKPNMDYYAAWWTVFVNPKIDLTTIFD